MMTMDAMSTEMKTALQACTDCHTLCSDVMKRYCSKSDNLPVHSDLVCMLRDCAEVSMMAIHMITDGSEFAGRVCLLAADISIKCAIACEDFADDSRMSTYAAAFRDYAVACKRAGQLSVAYFRRPNVAGDVCTTCA